MRVIGLAVVLAVSLILAPLAAEAQQAKKASRIGILAFTQMQVAGHRFGLTVLSFEVRESAEVDRAFTEILKARANGLLVEPSPLTSTYMARIIEFAATNPLYSMDARRQFPERGGLMSYGIDYADHVRA